MLRQILLATLLAFSSLAWVPALAQHSSEDKIMPAVDDDRWTTLPWKLALPFPWTDIQGLWKVESGDYISYFAFKVVTEKTSGGRQLQVRQIDGETHKVIANGVGFERNDEMFAQMTSCGGRTYRLKLTSFKPEDLRQSPVMGNVYTASVMVLSIGDLGASPNDMVHLQLEKVSSKYRFSQESCQNRQ